jgi:hypothetical protein
VTTSYLLPLAARVHFELTFDDDHAHSPIEFRGETGVCSGDSGGPALDLDGKIPGLSDVRGSARLRVAAR